MTNRTTEAHQNQDHRLPSKAPFADVIKAELLAQNEDEVAGLKLGKATKCFLCHASYLYKVPDGDRSGRFCSSRCQDAYDHVGLRYRSPEVCYTDMVPVDGGFRISCRSCGTSFTSRGLAYCSPNCQRTAEAVRDAIAAGHDPRQPRQCEALGCGKSIPRYTATGKSTAAKVRWCCPGHRRVVLAA
jgi:hypothetical protein